MTFSRPVSDDARSLHRESIVIDATSFFCEGHNDMLEAGGLTALNLTVPDIEDDAGEATKAIAEHYGLVNSDPRLRFAFTADDIRKAKVDDAVALIIGAQNARHMASKPYLPELFYRMGMRISQLAYNDRSFAADGSATEADAGLSREGRVLVGEMNRVGMVVDVSHVGPRSAAEAIALSTRPPIASHSNPRTAGTDSIRNIDESLMIAIADKGGVIGLSPFPAMVRPLDEPASIEDFLDIVDHSVRLVGIDHIGIGTDKEASPGAYPREVRLRLRRRFAKAVKPNELAEIQGLDGFASLGDMPVITQGLLDRGHDENAVQKILGLNFLRVFDANWQ